MMAETKAVFSTKIHGKCILAGEHAVLREYPALVLPVKGAYLQVSYWEEDCELDLETTGRQNEIWDILFWGVLDRACQELKISRGLFRGKLKLESNISIGAGMGASASLCVGLCQFLCYKGFLQRENIYDFAKNLENLFHGESSGVDIAVALEGRGLRFVRNQRPVDLEMNWSPKLYLTYSGQKGITSECVEKVKKLWQKDEALGKKIDQDMGESVKKFEVSLSAANASEGEALLKEAMQKARDCFADWGLMSPELKEKMRQIKQLGAIAAKPTGSGNGGYILSFWSQDPPLDSGLDFIPVG